VPLDERASLSPFDYDGWVGRLGSIFLVCLAACTASVPRTVPRVVDGHVEQGPAVAPYAYEWFIKGEMQAAEGRHGEAAMAFESATAAPASDVLLITRLAEEYEMSGAARRADRALSLAHRFYPDSARVALAEGLVHKNRGEIDEALAAFSRASRLAPNWSDPVVATAETLASRGHLQRASAILLEYLETAPEERAEGARVALINLAHRAGDPQTLARALAFEPGSTPATRVEEAGKLALAAGRPALAVRILEDALETKDNVELWLAALVQSGDKRRAAAFLASPQAAPLTAVEDRADSLVGLHEDEQALRLLAAAEHTPRARYVRGTALLGRGEYIQAATTLAGVPFGTAPFEASRVAIAECSLSQGRPGAAAEALSVAPYASLAVRRKLAGIYVEEGDLRAALRLFDARRPTERAALASVFELAGHFEEAAAYYASVKVRTSSTPRLRARAWAEQLASRGLYRSAIAILEHWTSVAPTDLYSRVRLVELLQAERRLEEAAARGRQALEVIDQPRLRAHLAELLELAPTASH
jgi:tetratricopeptide (TPR) repeat protein